MRLTRAKFSDLSGWSASDAASALASFRRGCAVLALKQPTQSMFYAGSVADWLPVCAAAAAAKSEPRRFFEDNFTPYAVSAPALFTGYYEPQIEGSRQRHGAFQTPVYGPPADLVRVDLGQFMPKLAGEHISGRLDGHRLVPYPARAEIDARGIDNAPILFWCNDPVALFFLQIQGSGRVRFEDGESARVAYAGENGRPYTAIGRALIQKGVLTRQNVSMASIRDWLRANPKQAPGVMEQDQSFVFFQVAPLGDTGVGSPGTLGAALTPLASLAIDARIHPLGAPFYVSVPGPDSISQVMIGQDTGGAIRGAARGDIFFGFGEKAEQRAGAMKSAGTLYALLPNVLAAAIGAGRAL